MPKLKDVIAVIETFAPPSLQFDRDNCGLIVGEADAEISAVLVTLDLTEAVVGEAVERGANLIVCHHPPIFAPIKKLEEQEPLARAIRKAIKKDIAIYAAHTSVDFTGGGLNDYVAELLGLTDVSTVNGAPDGARIGTLKTPTTLKNFAITVGNILNDRHIKTIGDENRLIKRAAVVNGSGGSDREELTSAFAAGADVFLTAEVKYRIARFTKDNNYAIIEFGHYDSELCFRDLMARVLSGCGCPVVKAESCVNPYNE